MWAKRYKKICVSFVLSRKNLKDNGFKKRQNISLPGAPTHFGPAPCVVPDISDEDSENAEVPS
jgi:hypothetical protein